MSDEIVASDLVVLDLLRRHDSMTVSELASALDVTATAVRQRLTRLMAQDYIQRTSTKSGRGRPSHDYALTAKGRQKTGANFVDLAIALWQEILKIEDLSVRQVLIQRVSERIADLYAQQVDGDSVKERMEQLAQLFRERRVPFHVEYNGSTPVLSALACAYPGLPDSNRQICALERQLFSRVLKTPLHQIQCRMDGASKCSYAPKSLAVNESDLSSSEAER